MVNTDIATRTKNFFDSPLSLRLLAEDIFQDLKAKGLSDKDILSVSSEILGKLTSDIKKRNIDIEN